MSSTKTARRANPNTTTNINPSDPSPLWEQRLGKPILDGVREALTPEDLEVIRQLAQRERCPQYEIIRRLIAFGLANARPRLETFLKKETAERDEIQARWDEHEQLPQEK
jgi:hypothetical protein